MPTSVPMIERRAMEAELLLRVYAAAARKHGAEAGLRLLEAAIDDTARAAGAAFAAVAPEGPSLEHFATVLDRWREGGVLAIEDVRLEPGLLSFSVTRCGYMERYAEMGVPPELRTVFSCRRDSGFTEGYSPRLRMERPETIGEGAKRCRFAFHWTD